MERDADEDVLGLPVSVLLAGIFIFGGALFLLLPPKSVVRDKPAIEGCYAAANAPMIRINGKRLIVLQTPELSILYSLEDHKGWALTTDRWLDPIPGRGGLKRIVESGSGEFVFFSREGEITSSVPSFELSNHNSGEVTRYRRTGPACPQSESI